MLAFIRRQKKIVSVFLLLEFISGIFLNGAWALSSGPSQPETQQFAPAGMDNMVDPFTGDFSYNIPLMDVGGYPINLNYASGITPDAEASWVGLGWNLNVGAINRSVRGLPDDFAGDQVVKEFNVKPNQTYGVSGNVSFEIFGAKVPGKKFASLGLSGNLFYNNYNGFGMSIGVSPSVSAGLGTKSPFTGSLGLAGNVGSQSGTEVTPTAGLKYKQEKNGEETTLNASVGFPFSTREGLKGMTMGASFSSTTLAKLVNNKSFNKNNGAISHSSFMGFAAPTYTPALEHDMYNVNASLNYAFTPTNPVFEDPAFGFGGYYSGQFLKSTTRTAPAYGYMFSGLTQSDDKLLDFNREKDGGGFNKFTTNLALTNLTYDIYQVSGQGAGGTYRLYRGDVGAVHDAQTTEQGYSPSLGVEMGAGTGPSAKVGVDATFNFTQNNSGRWPDNDNNIKHFNSENTVPVNVPGQEPVYFKKIGEMAPETDTSFLNSVQKGYKAVSHSLIFGGDQGGILTGKYDQKDKNNNFSQAIIPAGNQRTQRTPRTTSFTALTAKEARASAILPLQNYAFNNFNWYYKNQVDKSGTINNTAQGYSKTIIDRTAGKPAYHTSEIRVTDNAGARYVYGVPVYNNVQEEVTFAKPGDTSNVSSGLIRYTPGKDDGSENNNGLDNYFDKISTPAYAHSYLLTCVLSSDYTDSDGIPGPSDGDLGTYTKFNYTKAIDTFKWRTPYSAVPNLASFSEGMHGSPEDDKANYVYGEKEVWYLHSIETRTHVAEFYLKDRLDGLGAAGRAGGVDSSTALKCLDKIVLYSKPDKYNSKAEPIKTVHFQYSYLLCPNTPNSVARPETYNAAGKGKLTLRKIWFTYGNSQKGVLNPYVFNYADADFNNIPDAPLNPSYDARKYDRWGNYKQGNLAGLNNAEFPYTLQNKPDADVNSAVWAVSSISTPTGGNMRIYYESDDYAYVQDRQAMRMFRLLGASVNSDGSSMDSSLVSDALAPSFKNYLVVDLGEGFTPSSAAADASAEFRLRYLSGIDLMYYKALLQVLNPSSLSQQRNEYVPGYAEIDITKSSLLTSSKNDSGSYKKAVIYLNTVNAAPGSLLPQPNVSPIVRNGWMYARLNLNQQLMGGADASDSGLEQVLRTLLAEANNLSTILINFTAEMLLKGHSNHFFPSHSFVRLNEPDKIKLGGGHRIRAIVMSDNWGLMKSEKEQSQSLAAKETSYYGQSYDYTFSENGTPISAGVAAYEPMMGAEENPFRMPVFVREKVPLAPSREYYLEEPFGESFYPAPSVGYRQVVVTPLRLTIADLGAKSFKGNGTGKVQHEFYTAYDFPSFTQRTDLHSERHKPNLISQFMKLDSRDNVTATQGYYVELNDMHGKQKASRVFPEYSASSGASVNKPISEVEYYYRQNGDGTLNNSNVPYINRDLSISNNGPALGVDVDLVQDERFYQSTTLGGGVQFNLKYIQAGTIPILVPTPFPDFTSEQTGFRSVVTTKVVNKYGILDSTIAKDNGASIATGNLAWDVKTGEVLLTSVQNEFHDPVYSFTYPGHWAYQRMDIASHNEGMTFSGTGLGVPAVKSALLDGDELYVQLPNGKDTLAYYTDNNGTPSFINRNGDLLGNLSKSKVIRSGARNMPSTPVGTVVCLDNPIRSGSGTLQFTRVLNAGASEYNEQWKRFCNCQGSDSATTTNPYLKGIAGNIRPLRSWTYLTGRTQSQTDNNLKVRRDGYFTDAFLPFWHYNTDSSIISRPLNPDKTLWQYITEVTNYNPIGMEIENKDALQRYSMAQFGYGRNLPVATSNNSQYRESGYDGFEDYGFGDCQDDHFSWRPFKTNVTSEEAHTGRNSIKVGNGDNVIINKVIKTCDK
jgi:hypothetical protein